MAEGQGTTAHSLPISHTLTQRCCDTSDLLSRVHCGVVVVMCGGGCGGSDVV